MLSKCRNILVVSVAAMSINTSNAGVQTNVSRAGDAPPATAFPQPTTVCQTTSGALVGEADGGRIGVSDYLRRLAAGDRHVQQGVLTPDLCGDAQAISVVGAFAFDNSGASTDGPAHGGCEFSGESQIANDVWYCWTAPCTDTVFVRTCDLTDVDTKIAAYADCGCPPTDARLLACDDDLCGTDTNASMILFEATASERYLIRVGTHPTEPGGSGQFEITCGPPEQANCPGAGECCAADGTGSPGCGDELCCETVCACDEFCCEVEWDASCAADGFAGSGCGAAELCGCGAVCGIPGTGDCCAANGSPGCADLECCELVCGCDSFCCTVEWDDLCATVGAAGDCGASILCPNVCAPHFTVGGAVYTNPADPLGSGLPGAEVCVNCDNGFFACTVTSDPAGVWEVSDVPGGMCEVSMEYPPPTCYEFWQVVDGISSALLPITISVDEAHAAENQSIQVLAEACCLRYDMNYDGFVSIIGDVSPFVDCVYFGNCCCPEPTCETECLCPGDCNADGLLSIIGDVPCFVDCLYFGSCIDGSPAAPRCGELGATNGLVSPDSEAYRAEEVGNIVARKRVVGNERP